MRLKAISNVFYLGVIAGFFYGGIASIIHIHSHLYLSQKMYRLALYSFVSHINKGVLYGLLLFAAILVLSLAGSFFFKSILTPLFEFKILKKKMFMPLFKKFLFFLVIAWALYILLRSIFTSVEFSFIFQGFLAEIGGILLYIFVSNIKFAQVKRFLAVFSTGFRRKIAIVFFALAVAFNILSMAQNLVVIPDHPNVLLILSDALRADHLGCYGYFRQTSPNIDRFADECLVFERAFSPSPWTKTTVGSILTSLYPHEHGAFRWADNLSNMNLTLTEIFRNKNYRTFSIQANRIITSRYGFHQGFQTYKEMTNDLAENLTDEFIPWLNRSKRRPFFAYLHFMDTHFPYNVPIDYTRTFAREGQSHLKLDELISQDIRLLTEMGMPQSDKDYIVNLYDDSIAYFDIHFNRILDALRANQLMDKTIIILLSDHGEEFWRHGSFEHGHTLYNELLHVPLLIRYPSILAAKKFPYPVQLIDLYPTIISLTGIEFDQEISGQDLLPAILNDREPKRVIYFEGLLRGGEKRGVYKDGWKLIQNTTERYNSTFFERLGKLTQFIYPELEKEYELYDIREDFNEAYDLFNSRTDVFIEIKQLLQLFKRDNLLLQEHKQRQLREKLKDFKSLGYIK
jgi:arylsulfatase A-like enzyme